ncbi:MAG: ABC transporter ATP-binding protein [Chloroflexi bacterium]|nr:ABC transporter ATP-binding protein [Chloroflexota bacterium]
MIGTVLEARGVERIYGSGSTAVRALRGVDLVVEAGKLVVLRGRSGSGKTTLLNIIGGLDQPDRGEVIFEGRNITTLSDRELTAIRRRRLGFVFQAFSLLPTFSATENVDLALRLGGMGPRNRARKTRDLLDLVGLADKARHRPFELSGGEQQRVSIARALANSPAVILADEPTGDLDSGTGRGIVRLFKRLVVVHGVTIVVSTHDPMISDFADVTYHIVDGKLVEATTAGPL